MASTYLVLSDRCSVSHPLASQLKLCLSIMRGNVVSCVQCEPSCGPLIAISHLVMMCASQSRSSHPNHYLLFQRNEHLATANVFARTKTPPMFTCITHSTALLVCTRRGTVWVVYEQTCIAALDCNQPDVFRVGMRFASHLAALLFAHTRTQPTHVSTCLRM